VLALVDSGSILILLSDGLHVSCLQLVANAFVFLRELYELSIQQVLFVLQPESISIQFLQTFF